MQGLRWFTLVAVFTALVAGVLAPTARDTSLAAGPRFTASALPVKAVAPANGQLAPAAGAIQVQLNTASSSWTRTVAGLFRFDHYGMRLLNTRTRAVSWFLPLPSGYRTGHLPVSKAITYAPTTGMVTAHPGAPGQPGALSLGDTYTSTLAAGPALALLLAQDLGHPLAGFGSQCCAYPAGGAAPWSFSIANVNATIKNATSTSAAGIATATIGGATTNAGASSVTASATGVGTLTVASYPSSPAGTSVSFAPSGAFFDVSVSLGSTFKNITLTSRGAGAALYWYTGAAWQRVLPQVWKNGDLTVELSSTSSPSLSQLTGTVIAGALPTVTAVSPGTGGPSGGDAVQIVGTGFSGATSLQFGGAAVPTVAGQSSPAFTVISDTSIEVWATPAGSGTVDVTVSTPGGSSTTVAGDQFTYVPATAPQTMAIPSYIYPGSAWTQMGNAAPTVGLTVINPNNGPGASCDATYASQVQASQSAGLKVIAYVYTRYANTLPDPLHGGAYDRTVADVEADINTYYSCYPTLDGIFFDEASTDCAYASSYYATLSAYVKSQGGKGITVINPGNASNECYMAAADILVSYEGNYAAYTAPSYSQPAWVTNYPASRFWHLIYGAPDSASMQSAVALSKQRNAGWVYITPLECANNAAPPCDSTNPLNPWYALPADPYWSDELSAVRPAPLSLTALSTSRGPSSGGPLITVTGTGFTGATSVLFGTQAASRFTVQSDTQITVYQPPGTVGTTVDVRVVTPTGATALSSADLFAYAASNNLLGDPNFLGGTRVWALSCNDATGSPLQSSSCGSFYTEGGSVTLNPANAYQANPSATSVSATQTVPASASSVLTGVISDSGVGSGPTLPTTCDINTVALLSVTLLDASGNPLVATDPRWGNIAFGSNLVNPSCPTGAPTNTSTFYFQNMPAWTDFFKSQNFAMPIGSILLRHLPGIDPAQVASIKVQFSVQGTGTRQPSATLYNISLNNVLTIDAASANPACSSAPDDTCALQSALQRLDYYGGGILSLAPRTYRVQPSSLLVKGNTVLDGNGATIQADSSGFSLLDLQGYGITVANLTVDGNSNVVRGVSIDAGDTNTTLTGDTVENIAQPTAPGDPNYGQVPVGIRIYGDTAGTQINTTTVTNVVAAHPDCTGCSSPSDIARGIQIAPGSGEAIPQNTTVELSTISHVAPKDDGDCLVAQYDPSSVQSPADNMGLLIFDNTFDYCAKRAIKLQIPGVTVDYNTITNPFLNDNNFSSTYVLANPFPYDMYSAISIYASNVDLHFNRITGTGSFWNGIEVGNGTCATFSQVGVATNTVEMGSSSHLTGSSSIGVMSPVNGGGIENNTLNNAEFGITLYPIATSFSVAGNTFNNVNTQTRNNPATCGP